jgi:hypothetical protein
MRAQAPPGKPASSGRFAAGRAHRVVEPVRIGEALGRVGEAATSCMQNPMWIRNMNTTVIK